LAYDDVGINLLEQLYKELRQTGDESLFYTGVFKGIDEGKRAEPERLGQGFDTCQKRVECLVFENWVLIMTCLTAEDIAKINQERIDAIEESVAKYVGKEQEEYCTPVYRKVREIDGLLVSCYSLLAASTREAESLKEVESTWELMVALCERVLLTVSSLREKFPTCVGEDVFELAFEYRDAALKRLTGVREEIECQSRIPKGLFPNLN